DTAEGLESVQLTLGYDPNMLEVLAVRPGTLTAAFPYFIERHDAGSIYVDMSGPALQGGAGSLIALEVRVREGASGPIPIDLQSAMLNEGHLTIGVLPRAGADPTDARITVGEADAATITSDSGSIASFFESFGSKLAALTRRIGELFDSESI